MNFLRFGGSRRILSGLVGTFCLMFLSFGVAAQVREFPPIDLGRFDIRPADYSGLTPLGNGRYAVVSDKCAEDGFHVWRIKQGADGKVETVRAEPYASSGEPGRRDGEGIAFLPVANTLFISGEADQRILEYALDGRRTGRELQVPACFGRDSIVPNAGFEALCYDTVAHLFWTTTEATLPADGPATTNHHRSAVNVLRLQSFGDDLSPLSHYFYRMEPSEITREGRYYAMGVSALCTLSDGRLLVLERELNVPASYLGAECRVKIFAVRPERPGTFLEKTLLHAFSTRLSLFSPALANYEAMCLGARTATGRRTLLLVSDSQSGAGIGPVRLKDFLKVLVFD